MSEGNGASKIKTYGFMLAIEATAPVDKPKVEMMLDTYFRDDELVLSFDVEALGEIDCYEPVES